MRNTKKYTRVHKDKPDFGYHFYPSHYVLNIFKRNKGTDMVFLEEEGYYYCDTLDIDEATEWVQQELGLTYQLEMDLSV